MRCVSVVIADRHPVVLQGLSNVLAAEQDFRIVARCSHGASCLNAIQAFEPDIAILDLAMPDLSGLEILIRANADGHSTRIVFFTSSVEDRDLTALATAGAYSVILKYQEPEVLMQTLRLVAAGQRV